MLRWIPIMMLMAGCASAPKTEHQLSSMVPYRFKVRRPVSASADPKAGPGGVDYRSNPVPSGDFNCEDVGSLFREISLPSVRDCLSSTATDFTVRYRLRRVVQPYLEIENPEDAPACLNRSLPRIPVPREILFQSRARDDRDGDGDGGDDPKAASSPIGCYSSRVDIEADEILGAKVPIRRFVMQVLFPLDPESLPKNDEETIRWLGAWALTPLWDSEKKAWRAKVVPKSICKACLSEKELIPDREPTPVTWP